MADPRPENPLARQRYRIYMTVINFRFGKSTQRVTFATFEWFVASKFAVDQLGAHDVIIISRTSHPVAVVEVERPSVYVPGFDVVVVDGCRLPFNASRMLKEATHGGESGIILTEFTGADMGG